MHAFSVDLLTATLRLMLEGRDRDEAAALHNQKPNASTWQDRQKTIDEADELWRQGNPELETARPSRFPYTTGMPDTAAGLHPFDTAAGNKPVAPLVSSYRTLPSAM